MTQTASLTRPKRKAREGIVVSNKMQKTIVVRVERLTSHPKYSRVLTRANTCKVHDETNSAGIGDWVRIMETRPLSKDKCWRLVEIVRKASSVPPVPGTEEPEAPQRKAPSVVAEPSVPSTEAAPKKTRGPAA